VTAIFVLDEPADQVSLRRMNISDACMTFVEQSFSLNPTDTGCAQQRLGRAIEIASAIPTFKLTYPRDYSRLPDVRECILSTVDSLEGVTGT
jgi:hypothetical protein